MILKFRRDACRNRGRAGVTGEKIEGRWKTVEQEIKCRRRILCERIDVHATREREKKSKGLQESSIEWKCGVRVSAIYRLYSNRVWTGGRPFRGTKDGRKDLHGTAGKWGKTTTL